MEVALEIEKEKGEKRKTVLNTLNRLSAKVFTLLFYLLSTRQEINEQKRRNDELNGKLNEERQAREEVLLDNSL